MERAVIIQGAQKNRLFGVLHVPEKKRMARRIGVNIMNPGVKNRVAPNRINVRLARLLADRGFHVLRCDPFGVGDSEGEIADAHLVRVDVWAMIQRGLFVPDTLAANDFFVRESKLDALVLIGQCGGANTAAMTAARDRRVTGLVLADIPGRVVTATADFSETRMDAMKSKEILALGGSKVLSMRAWANILTFRSSLWLLPGVMLRRLRKRLRRIAGREKVAPFLSDRFNKELLNACLTDIGRMNKVLFLFAERDYALKEYQTDLRPALEYELGPRQLQKIDVHIIKNANHIYTEQPWQEELFAHICSYVDLFG